MKENVRRDDRGFTLVELIVSIAILAIVVVPLLNTFVVGAKTTSKAAAYGNATDAAQNLAETVQAADAATLLKTPSTYISGAAVSSGASTDKNVTDKIVTVKNYSYGGQNYDAEIELSGTAENVPVSSELNYSPDMTGADSAALADIRNYSYPHGGTASVSTLTDVAGLTRTVALTVTKLSGNCKVDIAFRYRGTVPYTYTVITQNKDNTTTTSTQQASWSYDHEVTSGTYTLTSVSSNTAPYYSICLFYQGFYSSCPEAKADTINIVTNVADAVRVFLVDTAAADVTKLPADYTATVNYRFQGFDSGNQTAKNRLVFSNLPDKNLKYYALKTASSVVAYQQKTTNFLVNEKSDTRKWSVVITLHPAGKSSVAATLKTTKLS